MDDRRPAQAGAQNPAYRPAHPPSGLWPEGSTVSAPPGSVPVPPGL